MANDVGQLRKSVNAAMAENKKLFESQASIIKDEINLFKEEFDARLLELSQYQEQIGELGKNLSLNFLSTMEMKIS